jgi:uncharacterized protein involved in outer membrane biogenesis
MRLRTILIAVAVLLVALVVTAAAVLMSIDFNQYKALVASQVKAATGRDLVIGGNFKLALSLTPSVMVDDVTFANAPGGSRPTMASFKRLEVQMQLMPLLTSRQIKVDRLILDGADILLETDAKGRGNWTFQPPGGQAAAAGATSAPAQPPGGGPSLLPQVSLVQIQDSLVTYRDGRSGATRSFKVDKLQAKTEGDHITFDLAALVNKAPLSVVGSVGAPELLSANAPYPLDVTITSGASSAAAKGQIAHLATMQGIAIDVSAKGKALSDLNSLASAALPPLGPYSFAGRVGEVPGGYKISNLQLTLGDSALTGDASLAIGPKRPKIAANLAASRVDLKDFGIRPSGGSGGGSGGGGASDGRVIPATPLPVAGLSLIDADINFTAQQMIKAPVTMQNVKLALTLADGRLQVKPFEAGVSGGVLRVGLTVDGSRSPAAVAVDLIESHVEAGTLLQVLVGSSVLSGGRVDMKLAVAGTGNSVRAIMAGLNGKLDAAMGPGNINNGFAKLLLADLFNLISIGGSGESSNLKCVLVGFDISRGLATARQLVTDTNGATIVGKGTIDLATEGLNLHLVPYATSTNLANLAIPMIVGGTMANPHVVPDAQAIAEGTVGAVVNAPVGVLNTLGSVAGIGGGEDSASKAAAGCGGAHAAAKPGTKPAAKQGVGDELLNGVGGAAKGAGDAIKGLLP